MLKLKVGYQALLGDIDRLWVGIRQQLNYIIVVNSISVSPYEAVAASDLNVLGRGQVKRIDGPESLWGLAPPHL